MFSRKVLMCEPTHFKVSYKINPWMNPGDRDSAVDRKAAFAQWRALHHMIIRLGGYVEYVDQKILQPLGKTTDSLPDLCFTANAGLYHDGKVVLANFRNPERQGESAFFHATFERLGYDVLVTDKTFEGAGDAFVVDDILFLSTGPRTDAAVAAEIMDFLGLRSLVLCDLIDPAFYHLDTCFCPLGGKRVLYYPGAFSSETLNAFAKVGLTLIGVDESEARRFACNAVPLKLPVLLGTAAEKTYVILPERCDRTVDKLKSQGYFPVTTPMDQFIKAGGACKCLTLQMSDHS